MVFDISNYDDYDDYDDKINIFLFVVKVSLFNSIENEKN